MKITAERAQELIDMFGKLLITPGAENKKPIIEAVAPTPDPAFKASVDLAHAIFNNVPLGQ